MKHKNLLLGLIVTGIVAFLFMIMLFDIIFEEGDRILENHKKEYKAFIGQKVILNHDTLLIVDYSIVNNNLTLSNGMKIDTALVKSIKIN